MREIIRTEKIRDRVTRRLRSYIATQDLKAGDRLPTESQLADQFGVSRLSVREATKTLEFLGIVRSKPGMGLSVGELDLQRIGELVRTHPTVQAAPAQQLVETRIVIETGVLPHVMRRMQDEPEVYDTLNEIVDRMREAQELAEFIKVDVEFHHTLIAASQLSPLMAISEMLTVFFREFRNSIEKARHIEAVEGHKKIIDLLRDQRLIEACDTLREHIGSHLTRT